MDLIAARILDLLVDDDEELEELFVGANFRQEDDVFLRYRDGCRLVDLVMKLEELKDQGFVEIRGTDTYDIGCNVVARVYTLTERGRSAWTANASEFTDLYELRQ